MSYQPCLPGLEGFMEPGRQWRAWNPKPHKLEQIKQYLEGYALNNREIRAGLDYIAKRVALSVSALKNYLRWLRDAGWIKTVKRKAHHAIRKVLKPTCPSTCPSQPPQPIREEKLKSETSAALPPHVQNVIQRAAARIRKAVNPAAYRQAIISCELRLLKADRNPVLSKPALENNYRPDAKADKIALGRLLSWVMPNTRAWCETCRTNTRRSNEGGCLDHAAR